MTPPDEARDARLPALADALDEAYAQGADGIDGARVLHARLAASGWVVVPADGDDVGRLPPVDMMLDAFYEAHIGLAYKTAKKRAEYLTDPHARRMWRPVIAAMRAALATEPDRETTPDTASEYGRLLAERDRLIADGADPADLEMPLPPEPPA